ncbi:MAG: 5-oxoprolinase subunit B family protein [Gammaproteobacteria bacterium]
MNIRFVGDSALLLEVGDPRTAQEWRVAIHRQSLPGILELVPGLDSLLVQFDPLRFDTIKFTRRLPKFIKSPTLPMETREHWIEVRYQGEDLEDVARMTGLDVAEIVRCHAAATYTVAFLGFAPGFPYLTGLDPKLCIPRLKSPRTKVRAGAVAIADEFSGIYPQASPGGWHILGYTNEVLFDVSRPAPALLMPRDEVHFRSAS